MFFFPFILVLFSFFLHKMATEKGVSPWGYLVGFISGFFVIIFATIAAIIFFYGIHVLADADAQKEVQSLTPFTMLFDFLLFLYFRRRIDRLPDYHDEDDDNNLPPNGGKKDLSYFR
jgi:hypothetical protein